MMTRSTLVILAIIVNGILLFQTLLYAQDSSTQLMEMMRLLETQSVIEDQKVYRPTPQEREALGKLINMKPRPKTFIDVDIRYLITLLDKAVWLGTERRIMHEMWTEATGKQWESGEGQNAKPARTPQ